MNDEKTPYAEAVSRRLNMMTDYEKGIREGIRYTTERFLDGIMCSTIEPGLYKKTIEFIYSEWKSQDNV